MKPIAITIIEDQREIREGLAILIDGCQQIWFCGRRIRKNWP
jgi:hypothetical protein